MFVKHNHIVLLNIFLIGVIFYYLSNTLELVIFISSQKKIFADKVSENVYEERQNQLRWQTKIGNDPMQSETKLDILKEREFMWQTYKVFLERVTKHLVFCLLYLNIYLMKHPFLDPYVRYIDSFIIYIYKIQMK